jgi:hypothetical protein
VAFQGAGIKSHCEPINGRSDAFWWYRSEPQNQTRLQVRGNPESNERLNCNAKTGRAFGDSILISIRWQPADEVQTRFSRLRLNRTS